MLCGDLDDVEGLVLVSSRHVIDGGQECMVLTGHVQCTPRTEVAPLREVVSTLTKLRSQHVPTAVALQTLAEPPHLQK